MVELVGSATETTHSSQLAVMAGLDSVLDPSDLVVGGRLFLEFVELVLHGRCQLVEVMAIGRARREEARDLAAGEILSEQRVAFVEMGLGLRHAELMLAVEAAYDDYRARGDAGAYVAALKTLDDYRAAVDRHHIGNLAHLASREWLWDREEAARLVAP